MGSKRVEEELDLESINTEASLVPQIPEDSNDEPKLPSKRSKKKDLVSIDEPISCLRNERVIVRYIPKEGGLVSNPKHILYGGMAENAIKYFTIPQLESGRLVNVLTDDEKEFLEYVMGLEYNALSIYKKENNYWSNRQVRLLKQDNILDLSDPEQYIKYKILLANKEDILSEDRIVSKYDDEVNLFKSFLIINKEINKKQFIWFSSETNQYDLWKSNSEDLLSEQWFEYTEN